MVITHRLSLDVLRDGSQANCLFVQGEVGARAIAVTLRRGSEPIPITDGMTAVFRGRKPDGTELYNSCVAYTRHGEFPDTIVYTVTGATVACPGVYTARFVVSDALGATLYSPEVTVKVVDNPLLDSDLESQSEYVALQEAAAQAQLCAYRAEEAARRIEEEGIGAHVSAHNTDTAAHNDLRLSLLELSARLSTLANSDDTTLDQMREVVAYIKANRSLIEGVTTHKIAYDDLVDDLVTNRADRPLSAAQGVALKALIDALSRDKLGMDNLADATADALARAKADGAFDGADGADGKSAYDYAREGGFAGTEAEFAEKLAYLMGYSLIGTVDEDNVITVSGFLPEDEYTVAYEMADGSTVDIGTLVLGESEPVNHFVVGGEGYIMNGRCSSGGADRTDSAGIVLSNYIKVSNGDTVYMNKPIANQSNLYSGMKLTDGSVMGFLSDNTAYITNLSTANGITQFTVSNAGADYIRIAINLNYGTSLTDADVTRAGVIITVNEPLA